MPLIAFFEKTGKPVTIAEEEQLDEMAKIAGDLKSAIEKVIKANADAEKKDVRNYDFENCSLVTSIFTLQFMPRKDRFNVLQNIYNGLNHGGAFIFAEKTVCEDSRLQEMITFNFYDYKRKHFDASDILEKEKTLRNMLKPNTWKELEGMLECAGFKTAQPFWRNHMFVGAIAIK